MALKDRIITTTSPDGKAILADLRSSGGMVMLLGSAISSWQPGGLPTGSAITWRLAEKLANSTEADRETVQKMIAVTAFEHVMECCPDEEHVRAQFASAFHPVEPNAVHRSIIRLVERGVVAHAVTTNYDTGLEAASPSPHLPLPIIEPRDADGALAVPLLFKIHGCASVPGSMVFSLRHERLMDRQKRKLLHRLIHGRTLLVMGYSGLDFELCPELLDAGAARVIWNYFDPDRSPSHADSLVGLTANARRVIEATDGTILWGNLLDVLRELTGETLKAIWSTAHPAFIDRLLDDLSPEQADLWRMRLYNGIGCARDAWATADRLARATQDDGYRLDALIERARSLFHMGRYREAVAEYRAVAAELDERGDRTRLPGALHGFAESCRVGGWYRQAYATLQRFAVLAETAVDADERARLDAELAFLRMLLLRNAHQVAAKARVAPAEKWLRHKALELLRIGVPYASSHGDWPALQQGVMWAEKLGIPLEEIHPNAHLPLPAEHGYRQLGYHLAAMMALRDQLNSGKVRPGDVGEPESLIRIAAEVGDYPEVWKFAAAFERAGGTLSAETRATAAHARSQCQESFVRRAGSRLGLG
jgi:tetratricopeptide (TPR) repeat protein